LKKQVSKNRNLQKTGPKYKQLSKKQSQIPATRKLPKKAATSQKNKPKVAGKPQDWQH